MTDIALDGNTLAACPFCGGEAAVRSNSEKGSAWVSCDSCGAESGGYEDFEVAMGILCFEAAVEWNRRASPSQVAPQPQAGEPVAIGGLYGPFGWLNGCRGLSEDSWELESDPLENSEEYFAIPLYALTDPFKEVGPLYVPPQPANPAQVTDAQIEHMVQQFLRWKLPEDFNPDGGISFDPIMNLGTEHQSRREPIGTNLFDYQQAKAMVQHMLDGLAAIGAGGQAVAEDATISEMVRAYNRTTDYIFPQATDKEQREAMRAVYATLFQPHSADERVVEALERLRDATPQSTNTVSADGAFAYVHAVAATALEVLVREGR